MIEPVYRNESIMIFKAEDLWYPQYKGKFFVLEKSKGYGYFRGEMTTLFTRGEILDKFNVTIDATN